MQSPSLEAPTRAAAPEGALALVDRVASRHLRERACNESRSWLAAYHTESTAEQAWSACPDGSWLLWFATLAGVHRATVMLTAVAVVSAALAATKREEAGADEDSFDEDQKHRGAILGTVARWARGEVSPAQVRATFEAANAAIEVTRYVDVALHQLIDAVEDETTSGAADSFADAVRSADDAFCEERVEGNVTPTLVRSRLSWAVVSAALAVPS